MAKPFAWSYSKLSAFELCPLKYKYDLENQTNHPPNEISIYGQNVHKFFEQYVQNGTKLPLDVRHHTKLLDRLKRMGEPLAEQKLAINRNLEPTDWMASDVWLRAIVDFAAISPKGIGVVCDYKTGKRRLDWEQVELQAAVLNCYELDYEIDSYVLSYYWTREKEFDKKVFPSSQMPEVWNTFLPRAKHMEEEVAKGNYPARANFLCANWCHNTSCVHNGKR